MPLSGLWETPAGLLLLPLLALLSALTCDAGPVSALRPPGAVWSPQYEARLYPNPPDRVIRINKYRFFSIILKALSVLARQSWDVDLSQKILPMRPDLLEDPVKLCILPNLALPLDARMTANEAAQLLGICRQGHVLKGHICRCSCIALASYRRRLEARPGKWIGDVFIGPSTFHVS